jgi:hypothetical protein
MGISSIPSLEYNLSKVSEDGFEYVKAIVEASVFIGRKIILKRKCED